MTEANFVNYATGRGWTYIETYKGNAIYFGDGLYWSYPWGGQKTLERQYALIDGTPPPPPPSTVPKCEVDDSGNRTGWLIYPDNTREYKGNRFESCELPLPPCIPSWTCIKDGAGNNTGYKSDGCGNTQYDIVACPLPCTSIWTCELPLNGYESDGCGNRRYNSTCAPPSPANITATSISTTSTSPNTLTIAMTWKNIGGSSGSFVPKVNVGGAVDDMGAGTVTLASNTDRTFTKTITGLSAGTYTVCPVPN